MSDEAGALRAEHTLPRPKADLDPDPPHHQPSSTTPTPPTSQAGATTAEGPAKPSPRVNQTVRHAVEEADPSLDDDMAMWWHEDSTAQTPPPWTGAGHHTTNKPLTKRKPYMTELLAFIALRRHGPPREVAQTFNITKAKARDYVLTIRHWLGTNPRTGTDHLPDARLAPAATIRDVPVTRSSTCSSTCGPLPEAAGAWEARGGGQGIEDLRAALSLVEGRPFDYPIEREQGGGWTWLIGELASTST